MKTKKVIENNSDNSCNISDVSSCNITDNESDTEFKNVVDDYKEDKKPIKNKKKVLTKKTKKVVENSDVSSGDDKDHKKPTKPIKNKKKVNTKDTPKKTLVEGNEFKKLQRKAKRFGAKSLDYSKRKNNKYVVEYEGKKIHFGSVKYEDYLIHKDLDRRE